MFHDSYKIHKTNYQSDPYLYVTKSSTFIVTYRSHTEKTWEKFAHKTTMHVCYKTSYQDDNQALCSELQSTCWRSQWHLSPKSEV